MTPQPTIPEIIIIPGRSESRWYAVHTKPKQESLAEQILQKVGIETFYPKIGPGKSLFTSYLFAKFPIETHLRRVKFAQGVKGIVGFGPDPAPVDETLLDAIRLQMKNGFVLLAPPNLKKGDRVQIKEGPLEGIEGIFDGRIKESERVVVLLNILAGQSRLVLPDRLLRKAS